MIGLTVIKCVENMIFDSDEEWNLNENQYHKYFNLDTLVTDSLYIKWYKRNIILYHVQVTLV